MGQEASIAIQTANSVGFSIGKAILGGDHKGDSINLKLVHSPTADDAAAPVSTERVLQSGLDFDHSLGVGNYFATERSK